GQPPLPSPRDLERLERARAWREERAAWNHEAEVACEERFGELTQPVAQPAPEEPLPSSPEALDARVRELAAELHRRDLRLGEAALRFFEADGWRRLRFGSDHQYARERAGMSLSSLKARMTLARRTSGLPVVREAL